MAILKFSGVGISAISACVPKNIIYNKDLTYLMSKEEINKTINNIGIEERRIADSNVCSSDLCMTAALEFMKDNRIDPITINALIFVSQTPDYRQPATSPILQNKLGLSTDTMSFDINLACSGYVYGLSVAYSIASLRNMDRVLLLVGDTMSKIVSKMDRVATPLFGDAGTATLVEKGDFGDSMFSLNSDGSGAAIMAVPYGGYRNPSSEESLKIVSDQDGSRRRGEDFRMDGMDVFNFGIKEEPKDIKKLLRESGLTTDEIDVLVYHQANKFMTDFFTKRLHISQDKTPYSLRRFGNTSSASIPLTIVSEMQDMSVYPKRDKVILSGFGAGLSWGTALLNLSKCRISKLVEY